MAAFNIANERQQIGYRNHFPIYQRDTFYVIINIRSIQDGYRTHLNSLVTSVQYCWSTTAYWLISLTCPSDIVSKNVQVSAEETTTAARLLSSISPCVSVCARNAAGEIFT